MAAVLDTLFVDVIARGFDELERRSAGVVRAAREVARGYDSARQAAEAAAGPARRMADQVERANRGIHGPSMARSASDPLMPVRQAAPTTGGLRVPPQASSGASGAGGAANAMAQLGQVTAAAGAAAAAIAPLVMLVRQGFQGTAEMERFGQAMMAVAREAASLFAPALQLASDLVFGLVSAFRSLGPQGQELISMFSGIGIAAMVLADPGIQSALKDLGASMGDMLIAARPLINQLAAIGTTLIKVFAVEPLKMFIQVLTATVQLMERFATMAVRGARMLGLDWGMERQGGPRREVTLNQTGSESAEGTFARIQEAVLKSGVPSDAQKQINHLGAIEKEVTKIYQFISKFKQKIDDAGQGAERVAGDALTAGSHPVHPGASLAGVLGAFLGSQFR